MLDGCDVVRCFGQCVCAVVDCWGGTCVMVG